MKTVSPIKKCDVGDVGVSQLFWGLGRCVIPFRSNMDIVLFNNTTI